MNEELATAPKVSPVTWLGLFLPLFGMLLVRRLFNYVWPASTLGSAVIKEAGMWLIAVALLVIVKCGEGLPLGSVGLGIARWWKSIL